MNSVCLLLVIRVLETPVRPRISQSQLHWGDFGSKSGPSDHANKKGLESGLGITGMIRVESHAYSRTRGGLMNPAGS